MRKTITKIMMALCLCFGFTMQVKAASCDCGLGTNTHSLAHQVSYVSDPADASQHLQVCIDCVFAGHKENCAYIIRPQKHVFDSGACVYCGAKEAACTHEKAYYKVLYDYTPLKHQMYCPECQDFVGEPQTCSYTKYEKDPYDDRHVARCVCGNIITEKCSKDEVIWVNSTRDTELKKYKCKCGNVFTLDERRNHVYSGTKCKNCDAQKIIPGATKITLFKQKSKMKLSKKHVPTRWNSTWLRWDPAEDRYSYSTKFQIKVKKAKNADYYLITSCPLKDVKVLGKEANKDYRIYFSSKKASFTFTTGFGFCTINKKPKKISKFTVFVTPVSKTGHIGKSVKKTVKLKY